MRLRLLSLLLGLAAGLPGRAALAQATAPSQGGEVNVVRVTATTIEVTFGLSGNGQGRVIGIALAAPGGLPVPLAATDDQSYTASTAYGQGSTIGKGYAAYNGSGHSATITGLQPNTYYYFTDAEYNTDGASITYNTHGSSMSTATRNAPPPPLAPAPLPVELIAFTGTVDAYSTALLHWSTATERNSAYFALQRSADGTSFTEAGRIAAAGTSTQALVYQWADPQRLGQRTYYRLQQVDRDGVLHYSNVVLLAPQPRVAQRMEVYPNPSAGQPVQLLLQGFEGENFTLRLSDALGRPILAQALTPADTQYLAPLPLPRDLPPGTYFLTLAGSGSHLQKRIVVSN